ncbi:MAG: hypothetical protein U1E89_05685 [Burkholderiaceae bacterium]
MDSQVRYLRTLIWLSLYAAAVHFADNVYRFDQYPEPAWMSQPLLAALLIPLVLLAHRAVDHIYNGHLERSFSLVHGLVCGHLISLGHYVFARPSDIPLRVNLSVGLQIGMALVLLVYALWLQLQRHPDSMRRTRRAWVKNVAMYVVLGFALETVWPSRFVTWWME